MAALDDVYLMQVAQELARDPASWGVTLEMHRRPDSVALLLASGLFIDFAQAVAEKQPLAREPLGFLVGALYYEVIRASEPLVRHPRALLGRMEEHYRQGMPRPAGLDGAPLPMPGQTPKFGMRVLKEPLDDPKYWPIFVEVCGHVIEDCEANLSRVRRAGNPLAVVARWARHLEVRGGVPEQEWDPNSLLLTEVTALVNRAEKLDQMGRLEEADIDLDAAVGLFARMTGNLADKLRAEMEARTYLVRGAARSRRGRATEAVEDLDRAVASIEPLAAGGSDHETSELLADCLRARGHTRNELGDAWGMRADIDRAVALESGGDARPKSDADRLRRAIDLNSRGKADYFRGRYSDAFENFDMAVGLLRELPAGDDADPGAWGEALFHSLNGRGLTLNDLNRFDDALLDLNEAVTVAAAQVPPLIKSQAIARQNRALAYRGLGRYLAGLAELQEAIRLYQSMLDPGDPEPDRETAKSIASCLEDTVYLAMEAKLLDSALENATPLGGLYQKLLSNQFEPELLSRLAAAYNLRGAVYESLDRHAEAEGDFTEAIDLYRKMVNFSGRLHLERNLASAFQNRGAARHKLKKRDDALVDLERARAIYHRLTARRNFSELERGEALALTLIARVRLDGGEWEAAAETYARSLELLERSDARAATEQERVVLFSSDAEVFRELVACLCSLAGSDPSAAERAAHWAERGRAKTLAGMIAMDEKPPKGADAAEYKAYRDGENALRDLDRLLDALEGRAYALSETHPRRRSLDTQMDDARRCRAEQVRLQREARERFRRTDPGWAPTAEPLSPEQIRDIARRARATLLTVDATEAGTALVAVPPEGPVRATLLTGVTREAVANWLVADPAVGSPDGGWLSAYEVFRATDDLDVDEFRARETSWHAALREAAGKAGAELWRPALDWLLGPGSAPAAADDPPAVVIMAGPFLSNLPHHASWWAEGAETRHLGDVLTVSYAPSARLLRECLDRRDRLEGVRPTLLATRNPTGHCYGYELVWTEHEADRAARRFSTAVVLGRDQDPTYPPATTARLLDELPRHPVALLATHGVFDEISPWAGSGLLTADHRLGQGGTPDLTLGDLYDRSLDGLGLVVMTACESSRSKLGDRTGDQLGLPSALLVSGAACVVGSLWLIDDLAAAMLTERLFLVAFPTLDTPGASPARALRSAQRWLRGLTRDQTLAILDEIERGLSDPGPVLRSRTGEPVTLSRLHTRAARLVIERRGETPFDHPAHWAALGCYGAP